MTMKADIQRDFGIISKSRAMQRKMVLLQNMPFCVTAMSLPTGWYRIIMQEIHLPEWKNLRYGIYISVVFHNRSLKNELERLIQTIIMQ